MTARPVLLPVFVVAVLTACGGDDAAVSDTSTVAATTVVDDATETTPTTEAAVGTTIADVASTSEPEAVVTETTTQATETTTPDDLRFAAAADVAAIATSTATSGVGPRPMLAWDPVDGAVMYRVVVLADDQPYWAWTGQTTSVPFGGGDPDGPQGQLAVLTDTATHSWTVSAWGDDGSLLAMSAPSPIAP